MYEMNEGEREEHWKWLVAQEGTEALDAACKLMEALSGKAASEQVAVLRDELSRTFDICPACCIPLSICGCEDPPEKGLPLKSKAD